MTSKKNSFLAFLFSLLPGAGEMYMGFMKRGSSTMGLFFLCFSFSAWLNIGPLLYLAPILWFYSFFTVHNIRSLPEDEFYNLEDEYVFHLDDLFTSKNKLILHKYRSIIGVGLVLLGISIVWKNLFFLLFSWLPNDLFNYFLQLNNRLPQLIIAIAIVAYGYSLIRQKKKELKNNFDDERIA